MGKLYILSIICVLLVSANQVSALSYKEPFPINTWFQNLTNSEISEAKLLQTYVVRYREKINALYDSYSQDKSQVMTNANVILSKMSLYLKKIQEDPITKEDATQIMKSIVNDLKILNSRMKVYLEQEQIILTQKIEFQKNRYTTISKRISGILDTIISQLSQSLTKKENLSLKEKTIVRSLVKIREENNKIKQFKNVSFHSENEMKNYLRKIIDNIRSEIITIKQLSN